nr:hypothetical protein 4 [Legionellales bacterium]
MSGNLARLQEMMQGYNPYQMMMEQTRALEKKWEPTGLLEGLDHKYERNGFAILFENQARELIWEASQTGTTAGSEEWSGVALPLVRRIFAEIAAKEFVSVQPMNLPSGLVFYLDFKYGTAQPGFTVDKSPDQQGTVHGITNTAGDPSDGLYGAGRFGYSINDVTSSYGAATTTATASWADVNFNTDLSASVAAGQLKLLGFVTGSGNNIHSDLDVEGVRAFWVSGSEVEAYFPAFTYWSSPNVFFVVSGSVGVDPGASGDIRVDYHLQPTAITRGDFEYTGTDLDIPEIDVQLRSVPIVAKTRKLKAIWTPEFAQDLNAYHSIDAEAELTAMLSEYISMEIDLEILDMLISNALTTEYWSAKIAAEYDATSRLFVETATN